MGSIVIAGYLCQEILLLYMRLSRIQHLQPKQAVKDGTQETPMICIAYIWANINGSQVFLVASQ